MKTDGTVCNRLSGTDSFIIGFMSRFLKVWTLHVNGWSSAKRPYSASRRRQLQETMEWKQRVKAKEQGERDNVGTHRCRRSTAVQVLDGSHSSTQANQCDYAKEDTSTEIQKAFAIAAYAK